MARKKRKSFTWIIVLLAIVVILYIILHLIEMKGLESKASQAKEEASQRKDIEKTTVFHENTTSRNIMEIQIDDRKNKTAILLRKQNDGLWYITTNSAQFLAEQQVISQLVSDILNFDAGQPVASGEALFKEYDLNEEMAQHVMAKDKENVIFDLLIGKSEAQGKALATYMRFRNSDDIYLYPSFLRALFTIDPVEYRNKRLSNISFLKMKTVEYSYPGDSSFIFSKSPSGTWLIDGKSGNEEEIRSFLRTLGFVMSGMYADISRDALPKSPTYKVKITGEDVEIFDIYAYYVKNRWYLTSSYDNHSVWDASNLEVLNRIFPAKSRFK
ncbi:MAG: DUF4340 domain-containing protein [Bacteroidales bacterium]|nr:DUF4340 domain-containing protein [Bacteroidales bacterium]